MATSVTLNGTSYSIPSEGDSNWGTNTSNYLIAISTAVLQKTGGTFTLTSEIDFGATYGIKSAYFKSRATNPSSSGVIRLGNNEGVSWRNAANTADVILKLNASDDLEYVGSVHFGDPGTEGAGINIGGTTYNSTLKVSDINGTNYAQTILHRHSTTLEPLIVGARSNSNTSAHTDVTASQNLFTIYSAGYAGTNYKLFSQIAMGASASGSISDTSAPGMIRFYTTPNASVTPGLALKIDQDKSAIFYGVLNLDAITASRVLVSGTGKNIEASSITTTTLAFLDATSSVQTQLDAKVPKTLTTTTGDMIYASSANTPARLPIGSSGQVLKTVAGIPTWATFSGGINYLSSNPDAEGGTTGWATYADAAGTSPVDGTGGSPSATWTQSASSPLRGSYSFLLTKDAVNRQGNGASFDFSIDSADKTKVIRGYFDYAIASGTYADDDVTVWIYDVTNATLIQPAPYKIKNHSLASDRMNFEFQTSSSTSYRLILHIGSTSASAYTLKCDNFVVGPIEKVYGSPITDLIAYTPTGNLTTNVTYTGFWKRIGDQMYLTGKISFSGTNTQNLVTVNLPSGYTIDTTKTDTSPRASYGNAQIYDSSTDQMFDATVRYGSTTYIQFTKGDSTAGSGFDTSANRPMTVASGDSITFEALVPIQGWSSSQVMSSDADTRVVSLSYKRATNVTVATSATDIVWDSKITDNVGMMNTSTGVVTIQSAGNYRISFVSRTDTGGSAPTSLLYAVVTTGSIAGTYQLFYQTVFTTSNAYPSSGSIILPLIAGDTLKIQGTSGTNSATLISGNYSILSIDRISGPAQIAANETVAARYTSTAGAAVPDADNTIIDFATKDYDYTGMVTTGASFKATAPISGLYEINVNCLSNSNSTASNIVGRIRKNGTAVKSTVSTRESATASYISLVIGTRIRLLTGEYVDFVAFESTNINTWDTGTGVMSFEIIRVGNY